MAELLSWVLEINQLPKAKIYAQFGEEVIFDHIFKNIGTKSKFVVDFGAGHLNSGLSNSRYLLENGWDGLLMDGNPNEENGIIKREFITKDNIVGLFDKYNLPKEFDLLSIDIDGNDYWVLQEILKSDYSPRVVINEFNGCIPAGESRSIAYNENHSWQNNDYYGASFDAFKKLYQENGYTLVHQVATTNMIAIRSDIVPQADYGVSYKRNQYHAHFPNGQWVNI